MSESSSSVAASEADAGAGADVLTQLPRWALWLPTARRRPYDFVVHYGGRAGGKSWSYARALVLIGAVEPTRVLCVREFQNSLAESSKETIEGAIEALGLEAYYSVLRTEIRGKNGTEFVFRGLSNVTAARIKSYEGFDVVWIEEAQDLSESSWGLLEPTIRKPGSQIWISFNPQRATDIVYRLFVSGPEQPARSYVKKVNYTDNEFVSERTLSSVEYARRMEPDVYRHRWLGELAPDLGTLRVLPMRDLDLAVSLYREHAREFEGVRPDVGLDVADLGEDMNALVVRRGALVERVDVWRGSDSLGDTARRADRVACEVGARALYFDASGVGAGVRSALTELGRASRRSYRGEAVSFGESVGGPDVKFDGHRTNRDWFFRRNAQLAWALKLRLQNTRRLHDGESVDPFDCLFVNPAVVEDPATRGVLNELNQPTWDDGDGRQVRLTKAASGESSPDMFDAVCLAFASDSARGLRLVRR